MVPLEIANDEIKTIHMTTKVETLQTIIKERNESAFAFNF